MWNSDISKAPHGYYDIQSRKVKGDKTADHQVFRREYVWLASKCGIVTLSSYIPDQKRWEFFSRNETPIAWHPFDPSDTVEVFIERKVKGETRMVLVTQYRKPDYPSELLEAA